MAPDTLITYHFLMPDETSREFTIDLDRQQPFLEKNPAHPRWTCMETERCPACSLEGVAHCPAALDIADVVDAFGAIASFECVDVHVLTPERGYFKRCDSRTALRSLLGLIMATGGCPVLGQFRGLARFHLPFANRQEALFRAVSACLLKNYFALGPAAPVAAVCELAPLAALYEQVQTVNEALCRRLRLAGESESSVSALVQLFSHSVLFAEAAPKYLEELRTLFE